MIYYLIIMIIVVIEIMIMMMRTIMMDDSWKNRCAPADSLVFADSLSSLSLE
jgi:hypothetical protein